MEHSYKLTLQEALDLAVETGEYNEDLGKYILDICDDITKKMGLAYRYTEFEVNFILKPRIVDDLLIKTFRYRKSESAANTFMRTVALSGVRHGIDKIRKEKKAEYADVFYYEKMKDKLHEDDDESHLWSLDVIAELLKPKE